MNLDGTCASPAPTHAHGWWSRRGHKSEQVVGDTCSITATVAMATSGGSAHLLQLILQENTDRSVPDLDDGIGHDRTQRTLTGSKWRKCDSFAAFVPVIDGFLNPDGGRHTVAPSAGPGFDKIGPPSLVHKYQRTWNSLYCA